MPTLLAAVVASGRPPHAPPLLVVGPRAVGTWLEAYARLLPPPGAGVPRLAWRFVPCERLNAPQCAERRWLLSSAGLGLSCVHCVRVLHCADAFAPPCARSAKSTAARSDRRRIAHAHDAAVLPPRRVHWLLRLSSRLGLGCTLVWMASRPLQQQTPLPTGQQPFATKQHTPRPTGRQPFTTKQHTPRPGQRPFTTKHQTADAPANDRLQPQPHPGGASSSTTLPAGGSSTLATRGRVPHSPPREVARRCSSTRLPSETSARRCGGRGGVG